MNILLLLLPGEPLILPNMLGGGNFLEVTEQILAKIPSENNN